MAIMETDVLVIGGGATGAGLGWDLALRGVRVVVAEMGDLSTGTSGRYHGLLHSGGRYAVKDPESAKECIDENMILRRIAPHALEDTGGLFILCPGDGDEYAEAWLKACAAVGIPTRAVSVAEARKREPAINPKIRAAYEVPDGSCDSWDLAHALQQASEQAGGKFLTYHRVDSFHMEGNRIVGARMTNLRNGETVDISCALVVNATGPWAAQVAALAGVKIGMRLSRGAMLAFNVRWVNTVINRLRSPGDGDIFVPVGTVSVTGTTSVPTDDPGDTRVERWEVERILSETEVMTPGISRARVLRAWAGVRPLYDPHVEAQGREAARTFSVLDHAAEGVEGFISVVGGKLTTFRLMAEKAADVACAKLGVSAPCTTATTALPAPEPNARPHFHQLRGRLDRVEHGKMPGPLICECELVTAPQIAEALQTGDVVTLNDLRRDLRLGMGPCQGGFCAYRAAALRYELVNDTVEHTQELLAEFVERRFGGVKPLLWGHNLRQALLAEHIYGRMLGVTAADPVQRPPAFEPETIETPDAGQRRQTGPKVVVVGAGLAGLTAALVAADLGARVELVAAGQGALPVHPGWIEVGDVEALAGDERHPYARAASSLARGLNALHRVIGLSAPESGGAFHALTGSGRPRQVAFAAGSVLRSLRSDDKVLVVGIDRWRDFYAPFVAGTLRNAGYDANAIDIRLHERTGVFDEWPVDVANLLDRPEGLDMLTRQVKPRLDGATVVAFPAVLGFRATTRARIADALGVPILEIPTLPPSVPGLRLFGALKVALMERGVQQTFGAQVVGLACEQGRVTGVNIQTANGRTRTIRCEAVILATGGLYGGGLETNYPQQIVEPVANLPVSQTPEGDWFPHPLLSGQAQPVHFAGIATDAQLRPIDENGKPVLDRLYIAGRLLSGYSPVVEGCTEGVDLATGAHAAQEALKAIGETARVS